MRKIALGLLLSVFLGISCNGQQLKVMTYNIWYANENAGENVWENRRDGIAGAVIDNKIDLVGMQEVLLRQLNDLDGMLRDYEWIGVGRDDGKQKGEFAPIFFKTNRFELKMSGNFWLSETPDSAGSFGWDAACIRVVTWVFLKDKKTDNEFYVFNTHFDHMGDSARLESAKLIKKRINEITMDHPVILTGDFNCTKDSEPYTLLTEKASGIDLRDCRFSSEKKVVGPDYSFVGSEFTGQPDNIIDHIFVSEKIHTIKSEIRENCKYGKCPSDHLPVIAIIELPTNSK